MALSDLEETHTRKIHLLISDITETDYHHEHPEPAGDGGSPLASRRSGRVPIASGLTCGRCERMCSNIR